MSKRKEFSKEGSKLFMTTVWPKKGRLEQEAYGNMLENEDRRESLRAYVEGIAHHTITPRDVVNFQRDYGAALAEEQRRQFDAEVAQIEGAGFEYGADYEPSDEEAEMAAFNEQQVAGRERARENFRRNQARMFDSDDEQ